MVKKILLSLVLCFSFIFNSYANIPTSAWDIGQKFSGELVRKTLDKKYPELKNKYCDDYWKSWDWVTVWCDWSYKLSKKDLVWKETPKFSIESNSANITILPAWISLSLKISDWKNNLPLDEVSIKITDKNWNDASKYVKEIELYHSLFADIVDGKPPIDKVNTLTKTSSDIKFFTINWKNNISDEFLLNISLKENVKKLLPLHFNIFSISTWWIWYQGKGILWKHIFSSTPAWVEKLNKLTWKNLSEEEYYKLKSLFLSNKNLEEIPEWVFKLKNLETLSLYNNKITKIPEWLSKLVNLKVLLLSNNKITKIPEWVFKLKNLEILSLYNNKITEIPEWISKLEKLKDLSLSDNQIIKIPEWIFKLKKLKDLSLSGNKITKIPEWISKLIKLESLGLSRNQITEIPKWISKLVNLKLLWLSKNKITEVPEWFSKLVKLWFLNLSQNYLKNINLMFDSRIWYDSWDKIKKCQNNITTSWKKMCIDSTWDKIKIWVEENSIQEKAWVKELNDLTGKNLSEEEYYKLNTIDLSDKGLLEIPIGLLNLKNLDHLDLSNNNINFISNDISKLEKLKHLELYKNKLTKIPKWIFELKNLERLELSNNNISSISDEISKLTKLAILDLNYNNLNSFPNWIYKLKNLISLNLSNNNINIISNEISKLTNLNYLKLWNNNIREIPKALFELRKINSLDFNNNEINFIHNDVSKLTNLEHLILKNNKLRKIPSGIIELKNLGNLNLYWNYLKDINIFFDSYFQRPGSWDKIKKCQNNITTDWKRLCIDSIWNKIKIWVEEDPVNTKSIKLTDSFKRKLDKKIDLLMEKLNNKYSSVDARIARLEELILKIKKAISIYPQYKNILEHINKKFEESIILYRTGLY